MTKVRIQHVSSSTIGLQTSFKVLLAKTVDYIKGVFYIYPVNF